MHNHRPMVARSLVTSSLDVVLHLVSAERRIGLTTHVRALLVWGHELVAVGADERATRALPQPRALRLRHETTENSLVEQRVRVARVIGEKELATVGGAELVGWLLACRLAEGNVARLGEAEDELTRDEAAELQEGEDLVVDGCIELGRVLALGPARGAVRGKLAGLDGGLERADDAVRTEEVALRAVALGGQAERTVAHADAAVEDMVLWRLHSSLGLSQRQQV